MTSDYYFNKWKKTLKKLSNVVDLDLEYQETKAHDKEICEAVQRMSGTLVGYIACYNDATDCLKYNLQIQKTEYIFEVVKTIVSRIHELKDQLRKLEGTHTHFLCNGLIKQKLTSWDAELSNIPTKYIRSEQVELAVEEALRVAKETKEASSVTESLKDKKISEDSLVKINWWEDEKVEVEEKELKGINITAVYEVEQKISEETLKRKQIVALIQAHEKSRQVIRTNTHEKQKRELWEKGLRGVLKPQAPFDLRERSAGLIQRVLRRYFELKREMIRDCKRDEMLHLNICNKMSTEQSEKDKEAYLECFKKYKSYQKQRKSDCDNFKENFLKRKRDVIAEEFRDHIRDWFQQWYKEAKIFYDIPKENQGGSTLLLKEEIPSPSEWLEKYETFLESKKANKNKTELQLKWEKQAAKEEEMMLKREELKKKKLEAALLKKMMKNPTLHPGYHYPISKKTKQILLAIEKYLKKWSDIDDSEILESKEKYLMNVDEEELCMNIKQEICKSVDIEMREELKLLNKALVEDYKNNDEQMPEPMKKKIPRRKRERKIKTKIYDNTQDKLIDLSMRECLKEYPKTYFENFIGDINYAGSDLSCNLRSVVPFGGEMRAVWWERCRGMLHGFKRILLVGPKGSGKKLLLNIMATVNDAILYELDPCELEVENMNTGYLQQYINDIVMCAKYTQPSIIYIRHIHCLYYRKVPPQKAYINFDIIKRFFIRKLCKKIHKHDNITLIGTCIEPWMTKSKQMLKKFDNVLLMPETNYSVVHLILKNWLLNNRIVPYNFDIHSLAHALRGYSFRYIVKKLDDFLTAERIVKIAAYGLKPQHIYDYFLDDESEAEVDYARYLKWYMDKTHWGIFEKKRLEERREFKLLVEKWHEKMEKKKKQK